MNITLKMSQSKAGCNVLYIYIYIQGHSDKIISVSLSINASLYDNNKCIAHVYSYLKFYFGQEAINCNKVCIQFCQEKCIESMQRQDKRQHIIPNLNRRVQSYEIIAESLDIYVIRLIYVFVIPIMRNGSTFGFLKDFLFDAKFYII